VKKACSCINRWQALTFNRSTTND